MISSLSKQHKKHIYVFIGLSKVNINLLIAQEGLLKGYNSNVTRSIDMFKWYIKLLLLPVSLSEGYIIMLNEPVCLLIY